MKATTSAALLAALVSLASAQDHDRPPPPPRPGPPGPILGALDANKDGIISADELSKASANLAALDKNSDGQITIDEVIPPRPPRDGDASGNDEAPPESYDQPAGGDGNEDHPKPPPPPLFAALDLNHDGIISAEELQSAAESLKKLDKNGDGQLTPEETHPAGRPQGPPPEGGAPRRGGEGPQATRGNRGR
ncbi:MAG: hypothetical protein QM755_08535 [Luteolibacter sp.]